ncbi:MAG TPA: hypothetical protein VFQ85_07945 [Mycobacteriales bacterium]|nr:hypothetical protein [Mycobacteriales bacterium]
MPRILLALLAAAALAVPAAAHADPVCVHPTGEDYLYVCTVPGRTGCVYGSLGAEANFGDRTCAE